MSGDERPDRGMRLQKFLSRAGVASRRKAEEMMVQGRVRVNGRRVVKLGSRVDPDHDAVEVDGKPVRVDAPRWIMLNKSRGLVTTRSDDRGRKTVYSALSPEDRALRYVGRLDRNTEGLLLFTNEGEMMNALLHPSSRIPREYRALVWGVPDTRTLSRLERGVELEDGPARAEAVRLRSHTPEGYAVVSLVLREGRKREVRRMLEAVEHPVRRLRRVRFGPLRLNDLKAGKWRSLREEEIQALRKATDGPRDRNPSGDPGEQMSDRTHDQPHP